MSDAVSKEIMHGERAAALLEDETLALALAEMEAEAIKQFREPAATPDALAAAHRQMAGVEAVKSKLRALKDRGARRKAERQADEPQPAASTRQRRQQQAD